MQIDKDLVEELLREFKDIKDKNTINESNLSLFTQKKIDQLYLSFINSKKEHYITFLNFLVKKVRPSTIVELGNREGLSTIALYDGAKKVGSHFYSVDIERDLRYCPPHMFTDKQMHFLFGDVCSLSIINQLPKKIDILFTDTLHYDFQVRDEWEIYQHLLSDKALVAIDDININDKRVLFDELTFAKWDLTELCHSNGWGLFLFERAEPQSEQAQQENIYKSVIKVWERKYETLFKFYKEADERRVVKKIKENLKKITPLYRLYVYTFNSVNLYYNKKISSNRKMVYSEKVRI